MNTNKLKTFAKKARIILMDGVTQRLAYWGFDENGNVTEELEAIDGGYLFRGEVYNDTTVPQKWNRLKSAIKKHTSKDIIEEAAYTWFNRLIAIKILEENNYSDSILTYVSDELQDPILLQKARNGETGVLRSDEKKLLAEILHEDDEATFALLLKAYCRNEKLLKRVFGHIDDYTELLLPTNLLSGGGIIEHINTSDAITNEDYKEVELIGWLYQFYISDKKDEVFAGFRKKKKARAEDIPAATQIFTPKWIVKYMVENTVGRIWLDKNPDSPIHDEMKYLVEPADKENYKPEPIINDITELTLLDPACGSGHILVVGFDLLMKMYVEEGYSTRQAVESIINNNLYGLDIDDRAAQLANFAVLLKAASYYKEILTKDVEPKIYSMPEPQEFSRQDIYDFLGEDGREYTEELEVALEEMQQAKNIGSALKLTLSKSAKELVEKRNAEQKEMTLFSNLKPFMDVILILASKFKSVVANPPYMGQKNMNQSLKEYINKKYPTSKADLMTVFIEVFPNLSISNARFAFITPPSWMFLVTFQKLRTKILRTYSINSLLHLSRGVFGADFGSVCCTMQNSNSGKEKGNYFRLVERTFQEFFQTHLESLFLKSKTTPSFKYKFLDYRKTNTRFEHNSAGQLIFYKNVPQTNFSKIPNNPLAYWVSDNVIAMFGKPKIGSSSFSSAGVRTGRDKQFIRHWFELNSSKVDFCAKDYSAVQNLKKKWFPITRGGDFRKWFGNYYYVINLFNEAESIKNICDDYRLRDPNYYFKEGITWTMIASYKPSFRLVPEGVVYGNGGPTLFIKNIFVHIAILNSKVFEKLLQLLNPTLNLTKSDIENLPSLHGGCESDIASYSECNVDISKENWDSSEVSWSYKKNELVRLSKAGMLGVAYNNYVSYWQERFSRLHANEEMLNKIFIEFYGLQDELTPDVALKDITILQDETNINEKNELVFKQDAITQQLLSYSIGCMMGRYRLDKEGLQIAHPNPTEEEIAPYKITSPLHNGKREVIFEIDDDAIIPLMGSDSPFSDDIYLRVKHFVEVVWGEETLTENLNFINLSLEMEMEKFLTEKFWAYHCKMYKKKPIYWLFSSPKGAFKVLVYMHRMSKFTVQKIRNNYLLKELSYLRDQIEKLEKEASSLTREDARRLDKLRVDEIECREYDILLKDYADKQIEFDLDDGVTVNYAKFEGVVAKIK